MRPLLYLITTALFLINHLRAQERTAVTALAKKMTDHYNAADYHAMHQMLSEDFQKKFPEDQVKIFFGNLVANAFGKVTKCSYKNTRDQSENYLLTMEKGELLMVLYIDQALKISGMQWVPDKPENEMLKKKDPIATSNPKETAQDLKVDSAVADFMHAGASCGLSIGVYSEGNIRIYGYGETERGNKVLPEDRSIFEIGSISKTFTGILLAHAVLDKKAALSDDIRKYLPGQYPNLQNKGKPITLQHLANHTSRIPRIPDDLMTQKGYNEKDPYSHYTKEMLFNWLKTLVIDDELGKKNDYSNAGMALLGIILEKVYGKKYDDLVREKICAPYELNSTAVVLNDEQKKLFCKGYSEAGEETPYWNLNDLAGAGGIRSSSRNMLQYLIVNMEEKDAAMKLSHQLTFGDDKSGVALAWHLNKTRSGNTLVWHNGGTFGFSSFGGFIREKKCAVVVLSNAGMNVDAIAIQILNFLQR